MTFAGRKQTSRVQSERMNCPLAVDFEPAKDNDSLGKGAEGKKGCTKRAFLEGFTLGKSFG